MDEHRDPRLDQALDDIRTSLRRPPEEYIAQRHLAAMRHAPGDEPQVVPRPSWRPRWVAASVAAFLGFTAGLGATDMLPNPAQHLVAQLAGHVGVDLPDPNGEAKGLTKDHGNEGDADIEGDDEVGGESHDPNHGDEVKAVANKNLTEGDPLEGCEHGQAVRDVASNKNQADADAPGQSADHDPCTEDGDGPEITGEGDEDSEGDEDGHGPGDGDGPGNSGGAGNSENAGSGPPS